MEEIKFEDCNIADISVSSKFLLILTVQYQAVCLQFYPMVGLGKLQTLCQSGETVTSTTTCKILGYLHQ